MMTDNIAALMRYRMEQAEEALAAARLLQRVSEVGKECRRLIDSA